MKQPFVLTQDTISHETVQALRTLLEKAERGDLIGIAYAVMNKQRSYSVDTAGELHRNPTFALGTVVMLDEHLRRQAYK